MDEPPDVRGYRRRPLWQKVAVWVVLMGIASFVLLEILAGVR